MLQTTSTLSIAANPRSGQGVPLHAKVSLVPLCPRRICQSIFQHLSSLDRAGVYVHWLAWSVEPIFITPSEHNPCPFSPLGRWKSAVPSFLGQRAEEDDEKLVTPRSNGRDYLSPPRYHLSVCLKAGIEGPATSNVHMVWTSHNLTAVTTQSRAWTSSSSR